VGGKGGGGGSGEKWTNPCMHIWIIKEKWKKKKKRKKVRSPEFKPQSHKKQAKKNSVSYFLAVLEFELKPCPSIVSYLVLYFIIH
jgi:hypothetical protein